MSPAPLAQDAGAATSPSPPQPPQPQPPQRSPPQMPSFDDMFHQKFMDIIQKWKDDPRSPQLTSRDRKDFIDKAYRETDEIVFGGRQLSDQEIKLRALTKVFYKVLSEEPWSEDWIRPQDVERKLSRFEMHKDSVKLASEHGIYSPKEAIIAARKALQLQKNVFQDKDGNPDKTNLRGPFDDIEIIYIPGTVSSTATNKIDRDNIYPVSVASVANILHNHICRDMTRPFAMAQKFVTVTDTDELIKMRQFACDVCDFAPHLLDNDNISLLVVLLILTRSEICRRFENNGIRIEGSTVSHRRAECMKQKLGWKNPEDRKPFDNVAIELQTRVKNACFPAPRLQTSRVNRPRVNRKSSTPGTPGTPPIGYFAPPQPRYSLPSGLANSSIIVTDPSGASPYATTHQQWRNGAGASPSSTKAAPARTLLRTGPGSSATEPMDVD
ncbi:hypothetical protein DPSP01_014008 [Paraphaeosphaeria sporulosa]|uniref:Uncharacterized protein n=1 Tax=Paraphaeosphaeria sporulosa TaxID=1460663 RepID=A0A177C510_9PLEO|nr:uncharacterized protein CC84DRAFT_1208122 [Paraphaeosphaeria sporulosa]OAG01969.1 hypothetical protein CC84DRAFT_1208122 [Paraphaeosphaeria sporulosa]